MQRSRGLLFGLNYGDKPQAKLNGCINDVKNMATFLRDELKMPCDVYTDDVNKTDTSAMGIIRRLFELASQSYRDNLDLVWIHYSGHGASTIDRSRDELDGKDECLVPYDYDTVGLIPDDYIASLFSMFNPRTRIVAVFDCCHSGTIGDVTFSWDSLKKSIIENKTCNVRSKAITISGCLDSQVSMDAFINGQFGGALTCCLLQVLKVNKQLCFRDIFFTIEALKQSLKQKGFVQIPKLCSTHDLLRDPRLI